MEFGFSADEQELEQKCRQFAAREIAPIRQELESNLELRKQLYQKMAREGLFSLLVDDKHSMAAYLLGLVQIAKVDAGVSVAMAVTSMVAETLNLHGTAAQKEKYVAGIQSGAFVPWSFALTEKDAGSDAKNISTFASKEAEFYCLNGDKQFITNGDLADGMVLFARNDSEGISAFIVERAGWDVIKIENKMGLLTVNLVDLRLQNSKVPASQMLGQPGQGFKIALQTLDSGRLGIAAQSIGIAEAAFEAACDYAKERKQFDHPLAENQAIAFKLADMQVKIEAAKLLMYRGAWLKDQGQTFTMQAAEAKLFASEMCNEVAGDALQIHGGYGYVKDYPLERYYRDARVTTIYEGTSEIQRIVIARHVLHKK